jgi:hypothetical protein
MNEDEMMDGLTRGLDALELRCVNSVEPWMELKVASTPSTLGFLLGGLVVKLGSDDAMRGAPAPPPLTHPTRGSDQASRVVGRRRPAPSRAMRRWNYPSRSRTTTTASSSSSAVPLRMEQICTVPIDQNRSFLIMRLRLVEMLCSKYYSWYYSTH